VLVERCRAKGMEPFVSLRLNDTHHQENYGEKNANSIWVSRFYEEHPEYMLDPGHKKVQGYSGSRGQNWMIPEVRAYKLALLEELAANYDLAGIELDFLRDHHLFRQNETTAKQRQEAVTGFVRAVRAALDRKGGRRYLGVRIPLQASTHGAIGLHVPDLVAAGVDMFNLSGWYQTTQRNDIAQVRRMAPGAAIYLEMTHVCGSLRLFVREQGYSTAGFPLTSDPQFYTTAHLAHERGADGLSLFNFVYFREHGAVRAPVVCEPPFHVLARLADRAWLARQPQYYWLAPSVFYSQLPKRLQQGKPERVQLDLAPPKAPEQPDARLRIHAQTPLGEAEVSVKVNGTLLKRTDDASAFYGNPFDGMMSDPPRRRAWSCPVSLLRDGLNDVEVALASKGPLQLNILDLAVR
ncbi:MAG TPA: hypothetical protein VNE39_05495, partial [Planctomycetota bacterium]|nr:hypothetical protein [Planctomycetota bacterium]